MPRDTSKSTPSTTRNEDYTFFYGANHINGWASQWYPAPFTTSITFPTAGPDSDSTGTADPELITFPTTEHWMMLQKALLFNDIPIARQILAVTSTAKPALLSVKKLGRQVRSFDDGVWKKHRSRIVLQGNLLKFRQNEDIRKKLFDTGETTIVEASPRDRVWGIGFGEKNALNRKERWGANLLGVALGETRRLLRQEEESGMGIAGSSHT